MTSSILIGHLQIFKFCSLTNDLQTTVTLPPIFRGSGSETSPDTPALTLYTEGIVILDSPRIRSFSNLSDLW